MQTLVKYQLFIPVKHDDDDDDDEDDDDDDLRK